MPSTPHLATPTAVHAAAVRFGLEETISSVPLPVWSHPVLGTHLMQASYYSQGSNVYRYHCEAPQGVTEERLTLAQIVNRPPCVDCGDLPKSHPWTLQSGTFPVTHRPQFIAIEVIRAHLEISYLAARATRSARELQRHIDVAAHELQWFPALRTLLKGAGVVELNQFLEDTATLLQDFQNSRRTLLRSSSSAERLYPQLRKHLNLEPDWVLDETPALVGLYPYRGSSRLVRTVVEHTSIRAHAQLQVVLVPLWVAQFFMSADRSGRKQIVLAPDEALARVAASLWDPSQDGPLGSLAGSLEVAGELATPVPADV